MDNRVLRPVDRPFEEVWPTYSYARLTRLILTVAERWHRRGERRTTMNCETEPAMTVQRQLAP